ncbi:MAG TPA: helix-turn-helix domain-containing protein [Micromonosporaceae bacterium]
MTAEEAASTRRRYRSPLREQQASQTRTAIIDAATELFHKKGWAGTGMRDVARAAGVSIETVYGNFRSKSELLTACVDLAVVADAEPVPLAQRPAFAALGRGGRATRIRAAARLVVGINERAAGVLLAAREAAASDPELARWRRTAEQRRRGDVEQAASLILGRPATREEADSLWAITAVEMYELLTDLRGWTTRQYERWLADVIDRLLPGDGRDR